MNIPSQLAPVLYFDLDGTLIDSGPCSVVTAQDTFRKFLGMEVSAETIIERMGIPLEVFLRDLSGGRVNDENWDEVAGYFRARYQENSPTCTAMFGGTQPMLQALEASHHMVIVTSKRSPLARYNLESFKIDHYFRYIIGSDNVEHYKPDPDPVYKARATLDGQPVFEMVIGDADTDIIMGKAAGVKTCAVTWGAHSRARLEASAPDYIADSFEELSEIILRAA